MPKQYNTLVYIGRFQPVHLAHLEIIRRATEMANQVIIIIGSADQPRTYKNPFTRQERAAMLHPVYNMGDMESAIRIEDVTDSTYNNLAWATKVQAIVAKHSYAGDSIGIIGHEKDESTFYLRMFPQWKFEDVDLIEPLNATDIRNLYFKRSGNMNFIKSVVHHSTFDFLSQFAHTPAFEQIIREREFIDSYKMQYASLAYPPIFVTTDAVVLCSGHVLMVKRKAEPGRGLWALPGGFLNAYTDASIQAAAIRELREETGIKVPAPVLVGSIVDCKVFDAVDRSARGRTITHAFKIVLLDGMLPKVRGADDAEKAKWVPLADVKRSECFDDHYEIIATMIGA